LGKDERLRPIINYVSENWGSPFVMLFVILMIITIFAVNFGNVYLGVDLTLYACIFLAIGLVLQSIFYVRPSLRVKAREEFEAFLKKSDLGRKKDNEL
jgi:hypothetical protein